MIETAQAYQIAGIGTLVFLLILVLAATVGRR